MPLTSTSLTPADYTLALDIWERSVRATHLFLTEDAIAELKAVIPNYFDQVDARLWSRDGEPVGFSGVYEQGLEMLFLDPPYFKQGLGSEILTALMDENGINKIDVNEDNPNAVRFYKKHGFEQVDRSELDGEGRPFPILHLALNAD